MLKRQIKVGHTYVAKVSEKLTEVRILSESPRGGWNAVNVKTGRSIYIRTAGRLRSEVIKTTPSGEASPDAITRPEN